MSQPERSEVLIVGSGQGGKLLAWHIARSGSSALKGCRVGRHVDGLRPRCCPAVWLKLGDTGARGTQVP